MNYNPVSFQDAFKSADVSRDNTVDVTELKGLFQHIGQWCLYVKAGTYKMNRIKHGKKPHTHTYNKQGCFFFACLSAFLYKG